LSCAIALKVLLSWFREIDADAELDPPEPEPDEPDELVELLLHPAANRAAALAAATAASLVLALTVRTSCTSLMCGSPSDLAEIVERHEETWTLTNSHYREKTVNGSYPASGLACYLSPYVAFVVNSTGHPGMR
jgi:hypothetical protein